MYGANLDEPIASFTHKTEVIHALGERNPYKYDNLESLLTRNNAYEQPSGTQNLLSVV